MFKNIISVMLGAAMLLVSLQAQPLSFSLSQELHQLFASHPDKIFVSKNMNTNSNPADNPVLKDTILTHAAGLNPKVLTLALNAYHKLHQKGYDSQQMLTIVDYSKPSTEPRLWVVNLKDAQVPFDVLVAHGKNSGGNYPTRFSDDPRSLETSIGVYLTGDTYQGKHGYSLRLNGLEAGFNNNARMRDIVMHAASYVSTAFARMHGRLGRSWGCMAVNPRVSSEIIQDIRDGTVLFAYYPDPQWLKHSAYLKA